MLKMQQSRPVLVSCKPLKTEYNHLKKIHISCDHDFSLGRSLQNSVVIPSLVISRNHCKFRKENDVWYIDDCSTCGVEVNGIIIGKGKSRKLLNDDVIKLDPIQEFVYKFINEVDCPTPNKRMKIEPTLQDLNMINDVKIKFEESQSYEIQQMEDKIQKQKKLQETNKLLKDQLHQQMNRKVEELEINFASQIENLKGKKKEIAKQKTLLIKERDSQISALKMEMDKRIKELMNQIQKHNEVESELVLENNSLKEKLVKEREEFLKELNRETSSKQELLDKLQQKIKEQDAMRLKEKAELEKLLQNETEELKLAKEKELNELAEQKKQRELELTEELNKIRKTLEKQIELTENQRKEAKQQLIHQIDQMKKVSDEDKVKMDQLVQEREEIQKRLLAAEKAAKTSVDKLKTRVQQREVELAALAAERIQKQSEQSGEVISSLQEQLEKVKNQLRSVESEKEKLLENFAIPDKLEAGPSKENTLAEVGQIMESELQCSICSELFVSAITLNCSHTFCKYCITMWKKKKRDCPICRAPISSECKSIVLDSFIDKMVQSLTDEMKKKREEMLKSREEVENKVERQPSARSRRRRSSAERGWLESERDESDSQSDEVEGEDTDDGEGYWLPDYYDDHNYYGDIFSFSSDHDSGSDSGSVASASSASSASAAGAAPAAGAANHGAAGDSNRRRRRSVPGLPGAFYGGYGRCYRCGARGHWAPGCPSRL